MQQGLCPSGWAGGRELGPEEEPQSLPLTACTCQVGHLSHSFHTSLQPPAATRSRQLPPRFWSCEPERDVAQSNHSTRSPLCLSSSRRGTASVRSCAKAENGFITMHTSTWSFETKQQKEVFDFFLIFCKLHKWANVSHMNLRFPSDVFLENSKEC